MWSDLCERDRNILLKCVTKEELTVTAAKLGSDISHPFVYNRSNDGQFLWKMNERPLSIRAGEAMFYARLGAELARAMDAEGYGNDPQADEYRFYQSVSVLYKAIYKAIMELETQLYPDLRRRLLEESRKNPIRLTREEIAERLKGVMECDPLCLAERAVSAYLFAPDFSVPKTKTEAERILGLARQARHPVPPDNADELIAILREDIEVMKAARALVRKMADRIDRHYGAEDHGEVPGNLSFLSPDLPAVPGDPYQPLRRIDALFKREVDLLRMIEQQAEAARGAFPPKTP